MKVLFLSHYSGLLGSNRSLASIVCYFKRQGVDVSVLLPKRGPFFDYLQSMNIPVLKFCFFYETLYYKWNRKYLLLPMLWLYNFIAFPFLLIKIKKLNPDVIYTNSSADLYSVFFAKILRRKHIMHVREFMQEDFGARCIFGRNIKKKIISKSNLLIFISRSLADAVVGQVPEYGKVIYNGLPIPTHVGEYIPLKHNLRIGVVGNFDVSKQQHLAIEYFSQIKNVFPEMTLHLVGDKEGPYKRKLFDLVKKMHLQDSVYFEGFIAETEKIYECFDVLLMCSRSEAFGRVTIEAMLRNKPVIGFNAGGTPELISNQKTGFLFNDFKGVLSSLNFIVSDVVATQSIVENARNHAARMFDESSYSLNVFDFVRKNIMRETL